MLHPNDAKSSILCFEIVDLDALSLQVTSLSCSVGNGLALERNNLRHQIYILRPSRAVEYWTVLSTARYSILHVTFKRISRAQSM